MWNQARFTPQVLLAELCPLAFWITYETTTGSGPLEYFTDYNFKNALLESAREGSIKYGQFANEVLSDCQCTRADSEKVLERVIPLKNPKQSPYLFSPMINSSWRCFCLTWPRRLFISVSYCSLRLLISFSFSRNLSRKKNQNWKEKTISKLVFLFKVR